MIKILIPDYLGQQVTSSIRVLGRKGIICDTAWNYCFHEKISKSRYVHRMYQIPSAETDPLGYIDAINSLQTTNSYDILLPFGSSAYNALASNQDNLSGDCKILLSSKDVFLLAFDKLNTFNFCQKTGIATPMTFHDYHENDLYAIGKEVNYPVVIKSRSGSGVRTGLRFANDYQELKQKYFELKTIFENNPVFSHAEPIIQEFIPGYIHDACSVALDGEIINILTQIRWWMYPTSGGVGAINYTTNNTVIKKIARKVLGNLKWTGPTQIEFKFDPRDKKYKLIEINPKFWGTLDLSIKAGLNFPEMVKKILMNEKVEKVSYKSGIRYIFIFPQASLAFIQLMFTEGIKKNDFRKKIIKTYVDFDIHDPLPDIYRALITARKVMSPSYIRQNTNVR